MIKLNGGDVCWYCTRSVNTEDVHDDHLLSNLTTLRVPYDQGAYGFVDENVLLHNLNGPAYHDKFLTIYAIHGRLHHLDGPAFVKTLGTLAGTVYAIDGVFYEKEEYNIIVANMSRENIRDSQTLSALF